MRPGWCGHLQIAGQVADTFAISIAVRDHNDLQEGQCTANTGWHLTVLRRTQVSAHFVSVGNEALCQLVYVALHSPHVRVKEIGHHAKQHTRNKTTLWSSERNLTDWAFPTKCCNASWRPFYGRMSHDIRLLVCPPMNIGTSAFPGDVDRAADVSFLSRVLGRVGWCAGWRRRRYYR